MQDVENKNINNNDNRYDGNGNFKFIHDKDQQKKRVNKPDRWCFYELNEAGSCKFANACKFSHKVPENGSEILKSWCSNHIEQFRKNNVMSVARGNSKIQHFLVNIMKEMISKEKQNQYTNRKRKQEEDPVNPKSKILPYLPLI